MDFGQHFSWTVIHCFGIKVKEVNSQKQNNSMKFCPKCNKNYSDKIKECPDDQTKLVRVSY